jgi:ATP-binding cassette subfamily B protein
VTHDIAETASFERVLVIEGGRIIEDGAPALLARAPSRYASLLEAEQRVKRELWGSERWRRLRIEGGILADAGRN